MNKVLFLDDEESILNTYRRMLFNSRVEGYFASNIEMAQKIVEENDINLIVSDYRLKAETGLEFLIYLRSKKFEIPMIIISGYAEEDLIKCALNENVVQEYLIKPVNSDSFRAIISKYLKREIDYAI